MLSDQWISFEVGSETYAHSVDKIKEIIPYVDPVPVPGAPGFAEGILNVRGNVVTILSSRSLFNLEESGTLEDGRIIIFELGDEQLGISVDSVGDIIAFQSDHVEWSDQGGQFQLIKGTFHLDGQLYILTDFSSCADICHKSVESLNRKGI